MRDSITARCAQLCIGSVQSVFHCNRELEYQYDQFLLDLTEDILSRNVMSDKEMESLCSLHINRNKYHLREV